MAKAKKNNVNNTINIKSLPVQCHIGASKFVNDDWGTIAFSIPRNRIQNKFADMELRYNFIYFLFGYENSKEVVYVGQAKKRNNGESVLARLREHDDSTTEKYRDKWEWIIAVTNKDDAWGLDDLNALEHAFYNEIPADQNLNGNKPNYGGADYDAYVDKISQIKSLITAIGFSIFSDEETTEKMQVTSEINEFTIVEDLQNGMARIPEIVTPQKVVKAMVDMLPAEVWNSHTTFLDPACKGGEYLREIYDRLMETETLQAEFPNAIERSNHILKNQIYGIALSQVSLERTTKKLLGEDRNIHIIPDYINKLKGFNMGIRPDGSPNNIQDILNKEFGKEMKIDVVIGNPPYQESNGGGARGIGGNTLYNRFIDAAINVAPIVCMITKNNWFQSEVLEKTRLNMLEAGITEIVNYPVVGEVFHGVDVSVCIFCINNKNNGMTHYKKIENNKVTSEYTENIASIGYIPDSILEIGIVRKTKASLNFSEAALSNTPFGIRTNGKKSSGYFVDESQIKTEEYNIALLYMDGSSTYFNYIPENDIERNIDILGSYKVICGQQLNKNKSVLTNIKGLSPNQVCTSSFGVVYYSNIKEEAYSAYLYANTKFFRFLVYCSIDTVSTISPSRFKLVPMQKFTSDSDIDWSKSVDEIDQQLYKKYELTQEEIDYIEKTIKPMT